VSASAETTGSSSVDTLHFVVKKSPGSDDIDLQDLTIDYQSDSEQKTLEQGGASGFAFTITEEKGNGNDVLDTTAERYRLTIDLTNVDSAIDEGGEATVTFVDQSGAATIYGVNVPDTISGGSYVTV
jgi:archaellin